MWMNLETILLSEQLTQCMIPLIRSVQKRQVCRDGICGCQGLGWMPGYCSGDGWGFFWGAGNVLDLHCGDGRTAVVS